MLIHQYNNYHDIQYIDMTKCVSIQLHCPMGDIHRHTYVHIVTSLVYVVIHDIVNVNM